MRMFGLVVGLLLCASYEGRADAKRREPATRSEALFNCKYHAGSAGCYRLIEVGEAAFEAGRWHPSKGPFRTGTGDTGSRADCSDTATGTSFGRWYGVQCSYLSNIDNDPEFPVFVRKRDEPKRQTQDEEEHPGDYAGMFG